MGAVECPRKVTSKDKLHPTSQDLTFHNHKFCFAFLLNPSYPTNDISRGKPEFFVPGIKDDVKENKSLLLNESKSKVTEMEKEKKDGKFGVDCSVVSYILTTHQMEAGKMVMNCDLTKQRSNDELLLHRY
uniref:Uncharacterized protein n=1 Tax=Lactuca sativa TaxID=4236 RepID=A0A9R1WL12_LACSA|nr:hypothetical protein LSAT_V11C100041730 [Lactuca sativa]